MLVGNVVAVIRLLVELSQTVGSLLKAVLESLKVLVCPAIVSVVVLHLEGWVLRGCLVRALHIVVQSGSGGPSCLI